MISKIVEFIRQKAGGWTSKNTFIRQPQALADELADDWRMKLVLTPSTEGNSSANRLADEWRMNSGDRSSANPPPPIRWRMLAAGEWRMGKSVPEKTFSGAQNITMLMQC